MNDLFDSVIATYACGEGNRKGVKFSRFIWFTVKNQSRRCAILEGRIHQLFFSTAVSHATEP